MITERVEKIIKNDNVGAFQCNIQGVDVEVRSHLNVYQPLINDHKPVDYE